MLLSAKKDDSVEMAHKLFGKGFFPHKSKDGLAEAALIAYYGAKDLIQPDEDPLS